MSIGLETYCGRILDEVVTVSERIRHSAVAYVNKDNLIVHDRLRCQLETIRVSADAILVALTHASFTSDSLDERVMKWLFSGELPSCLSKLEEMDTILKPVGRVWQTRSFRPAEDKLLAAMTFFDTHNSLFYFLLTPDVWNRDNHTLPRIDATQHHPQHAQSSSVAETGQDSKTEYCTASEYDTALAYDHAETRDSKFPRQKLDEVLRWLASLDCMDRHTHTLRLRQAGTCMWFPHTDAYKNWRTGGNRFLWLYGKAGGGKSVLIASTIDHLKMTQREEEVVVFFYCDFRDGRSTSPTEVIRSVLSQLCRHLRDHDVDPGDLLTKILEQKSQGTISPNDLDTLCYLVLEAATCFRYDPIIVIDALDECADIEALIHAIVMLIQGDVRLLVTSRPQQAIMHHLTRFSSVSLEDMAKNVAGDIALHVGQQIDSHDRLRSVDLKMKEEICAELNNKAEGRFRWVQCQLDTLKRCETREGLREVLDNLPNELEATYERILGEIDERKSDGKMARRVLAWLAVAFEPLRLAQIVNGLSTDSVQKNIDRQTESLGHALMHTLSSLVTHYEETDVLAFSHFTVKEYLCRTTALPMYYIVPHEAHAEAAQICMCSITNFLKREPTRGNAAQSSLTSFPILSYILSSGFNHLAHVHPESPVIFETLHSLGLEVHQHPTHWERLCELREEHLRWPYPPWPSSRHDFVLYILIAYASPAFLQSFLCDRLWKPRIGINPLVYAADLRKSEHAIVLLRSGADVCTRGFVVDDSYHAFPLDIAMDSGDDMLVSELLQRGCVVTSELLSTAICMPWCSTRVLVKLMQTDAFIEWARDIGDEKLYRSVFNSARPNAGDSKKAEEDHLALGRILDRVGVNLAAESPFGAELIERAIHAGHISMLKFLLPPDQPPPPQCLLTASVGNTSETVSVVQWLLHKGVNVHAVSDDGRGDTALHLAAACPWESRSVELTRLLLDAGCNPHACNYGAETIFEVAMRNEYTSVMDLLLSRNIHFPPDILLIALWKYCSTPDMIKYLIQMGANVHFTTSGEATVLDLSITKYDDEARCLELIGWFIEAGCIPTQTVIEAAIMRGYTSVVELLLSYDVPFPTDVLPIALQRRLAPEMVEYLVHKGADICSTTVDGDTVLHLTINYYNEASCLKLVSMFIEGGCTPVSHNVEGQTVLEAAIVRGYTSVVEILFSYGVTCPTDFLQVVQQERLTAEMVEYLIQNGIDLGPCDTVSKPATGSEMFNTTFNEDDICELIANAFQLKIYSCGWLRKKMPCNAQVTARDLARHLRDIHGVDRTFRFAVFCQWEDCRQRCDMGTIIRHVQEMHLEQRWPCPRCGLQFTRRGVMDAHRASCSGG